MPFRAIPLLAILGACATPADEARRWMQEAGSHPVPVGAALRYEKALQSWEEALARTPRGSPLRLPLLSGKIRCLMELRRPDELRSAVGEAIALLRRDYDLEPQGGDPLGDRRIRAEFSLHVGAAALVGIEEVAVEEYAQIRLDLAALHFARALKELGTDRDDLMSSVRARILLEWSRGLAAARGSFRRGNLALARDKLRQALSIGGLEESIRKEISDLLDRIDSELESGSENRAPRDHERD